jgi:hypothetical protein
MKKESLLEACLHKTQPASRPEIKNEILETLKSAIKNDRISKFKNKSHNDESMFITMYDYSRTETLHDYINCSDSKIYKSISLGEQIKVKINYNSNPIKLISDRSIKLEELNLRYLDIRMTLCIKGKTNIYLNINSLNTRKKIDTGFFTQKRLLLKDKKFGYEVFTSSTSTPVINLNYNGFNYEISIEESFEIVDLFNDEYTATKIKELKEIQDI